MRHVITGAALALLLWAPAAPARTANRSPAPVGFQDCAHCPQMLALPGGTFIMGSSESESGHDPMESPQRKVTVRRFAAGRYDVTRTEWAYFVGRTHRATPLGCQWTGKSGPEGEKSASWQDLGFAQTPLDPVVCVTWQDAKDYAAWLSRMTGKHYRLLSEAEWEFAARAGTTTPYWWGAGDTHEHANHGTEECCGGRQLGRDTWMKTSPGNAFPPNPFGLYDMSGNVMQWVEDCLSPTYAGLPTDGSPYLANVPLVASGDLKDLSGMASCKYRVVRGGDWGDQAGWVRSASRSFAPPPGPGPDLASYRSGGVGFRIARDLR